MVEYLDGKKYHNLRKEEQLNKTRIIYSELKDLRTLDVGCGTGLSSSLFSDVIGIDPQQELLDENKFNHIKGEAENLPFKDDEFENVISVTARHNFNDINKGLDEIKRVGKNFGISILKRSSKFNEIDKLINEKFKVKKIIDEGIDVIYICEK